MEKLIEQLQSNTEALNSLKERYYNTQMGTYWTFFSTEHKRAMELDWILKIQKRVLRMRYRILENLNAETIKEMQKTSTETRAINLKAA